MKEKSSMKNRLGFFFAALLFTLVAAPADSSALTIGGAVRQPLNLSTKELARFDSVTVQLNELTRAKQFKGVFRYRGVPLRNLLELATIAKDGPGFWKPTDLAIVVRNREGKRTVLSWGEVFYKNPSNVVVAYAATPVIPHHEKSCVRCHPSSLYQPVLDTLKRPISFPKLVLPNDFYSDRCLEDIVSIEVIDIKADNSTKKPEAHQTAGFTIRDITGKSVEISSLTGYSPITITYKEFGEGRGYHGIRKYTGVPLTELLRPLDNHKRLDRLLLLTSKDGYRSTFSFGEVFLNPLGERLIVAGTPGTAAGKNSFTLVPPDDLAADRMLKDIDTIEILSLQEEPKVYIISIGCADPNLITLEAISAMGKADAFIASKETMKEFAPYLAGKPLLFDPMGNFEPRFRKSHPDLSPAKLKKQLAAQRAADMKKIRDTLDAGKSIALLDHGDPTIYGGWQHWIEPEVAGRFEVVTGISAYNAVNALFANRKIFSGISAFDKGKQDNLLCNKGSAILSAPRSLAANEGLLKAIAESGDTLAIFMGLGDMDTLEPLLKKYYAPGSPVAIVYRAGSAKEARLVMTTLGELRKVVEANSEKMAGMIYLGTCLAGK